MPADSPAMHPVARYLVTVSGRSARVLGLAGVALAVGSTAAAVAWSGQVAVGIAFAGVAGGVLAALFAVRRVAAAQREDVARLSALVERRAEQVAALSHEL